MWNNVITIKIPLYNQFLWTISNGKKVSSASLFLTVEVMILIFAFYNFLHTLVVHSLLFLFNRTPSPHAYPHYFLQFPACTSFKGLLHLLVSFLKPRPSPSHCHQLHLVRRSIRCPGHGAGPLADSCTQPGYTGWNTGPAGGVGPGDSMQPVPGPAEGWPRGSPPPVKPRSLRHSAGLSSRELSHEAGPVDPKSLMIWQQEVKQVKVSLTSMTLVLSSSLVNRLTSPNQIYLTHYSLSQAILLF